MNVEQEILAIKERNRRVEADKAWETSNTRAFLILVVTYIFATLVLWIINVARPFLSSLIPTLGFFLSVQSFPFVKRWWLKRYAP